MEPIQLKESDHSKRKRFTPEEDKKMRELVKEKGTKQWDLISKEIGNRTARQCRDRWNNYLSPNVSHREWTIDEDRLLIQCLKEFGSRWSNFVIFFPGRTDVNIKNRWNKLQRQYKKIVLGNLKTSNG